MDSGTFSSAVLKMGIPSFSSCIHTAYIDEDSSILGTFREKPAPFLRNKMRQRISIAFHNVVRKEVSSIHQII